MARHPQFSLPDPDRSDLFISSGWWCVQACDVPISSETFNVARSNFISIELIRAIYYFPLPGNTSRPLIPVMCLFPESSTTCVTGSNL